MPVLGILGLLAVAYFVLASLRGIRDEGLSSGLINIFQTIGERAIQIDRLGRFGPLRSPRSMTYVDIDLRRRSATVSCDSDIIAREFDPASDRTVEVVIFNLNPIEVYIVYNGRPPNFDPFFDPLKNEKYLSPMPYLNPGYQSAEKPYQAHIKRNYESLIRGRAIEWSSKVCKDFSYTKFTEDPYGRYKWWNSQN